MGGGTPYKGDNPITPGKTDITLAAHTLLRTALTIKGDPDLIASNIRKGKDIFGVLGTLAEGADLSTIGITKATCGSVTFAKKTLLTQSITHNLGVKPQVLFMYSMNSVGSDELEMWFAHLKYRASGIPVNGDGSGIFYGSTITATTFAVNAKDASYLDARYYKAGVKYNWVVMA